MGSNSDEGTTFLSDSVRSQESLRSWCNRTFGPSLGETVSDYYTQRTNAGDFGEMSPRNPQSAYQVWDKAAQQIIGDAIMWCPARSAAKKLSKAGHKVFMYDFVHQPASSVNWPTGTENLGAFHGSEVPFVYGDTFELVGGELTLSESMSQFWTNMASSGDPNVWSGPTAPMPVRLRRNMEPHSWLNWSKHLMALSWRLPSRRHTRNTVFVLSWLFVTRNVVLVDKTTLSAITLTGYKPQFTLVVLRACFAALGQIVSDR